MGGRKNKKTTLLLLDQSSGSKKSAKALKDKYRFGESNHDPIDFSNEKAPFKAIKQPEDLATIVCVSHSVEINGEVVRVGDFTPHDFANKFSKQFSKKFKNDKKCNVEDLYLVCCEAGLKNNGPSLAQRVSVEMVKEGFLNVRVHAIMAPDENYNAMVVTIVEQGGTSGTGSLHALAFKDDQYERYKDIERRTKLKQSDPEYLRANAKERTDFMANVKKLHWGETDIKATYDKPDNTVQPDTNGAAHDKPDNTVQPDVDGAAQRLAKCAPAPANRGPAAANNNSKPKQPVTTTLTLADTVGALVAYATQLEADHAKKIKEWDASPFSCFMFLMSTRKADKARELRAVATSLKRLKARSDVDTALIQQQVKIAIKGKTNILYKHGIFGVFGTCRTKQLIQSIENGTLQSYLDKTKLDITNHKSLEISVDDNIKAFKKGKKS